MKLRANVRPQWQWAKLKQLLAIVLMFWGTISMYGQSKMISGIVQSESDGEPLVGATVIVKETKAGGTTDLNGRYSVQAGQGQTLIVSYIGYRSKEIKVGKNSRIDVQLQEVNPAKRNAMVVKNEKRFLKQKRNALKNPGYSRHPVKTQASFKRLLKAV